MGRTRSFAALLVAGCLALTACGGSSGSGADAAAASGAKNYKIGIVSFSAADQTSQLAIKGLTDTAPKNWEITTVDPQGSPDKAVAAMQNLVQKKVDFLFVTVFPSTSLTAGLVAAKAANIPVLSYSGGLADGVQVNYDGGYASGQIIAKQLAADTGGKGDLLALGYSSGLPCVGREKALTEALAGSAMTTSREEVPIPGQVEASTNFTQAWLTKHPANGDGLAVWGCFDDPSLGAIAAIKQAGRTGVKVYGINGQPAALTAVQNGDMTATVYLDVYAAGKKIAESIPGYIEAGTKAQQQEIPIPAQLVDKANVAQFLKDNPTALTG